jgi:NitT/TauT family transport system substrate-binding protein
MMRKLIALFTATTIMLAVLCTACGTQDSSDDFVAIRVAFLPNVTHAQALLMVEQKRLEEAYGSEKVSWTPFNTGTEITTALFAQEIDIAYIGPVPAITAYSQSKGDVRIIAGAANGGSVLVAREGSNIETVADLSGKTVTVASFGNNQHLSLLALLSKNGLAPTSEGGDVDIRSMANADVVNLMNDGTIDAAFVPEPWGSVMVNNGSAYFALDYDEIDANGIPNTTVIIVRQEFYDKHPDVVREFLGIHNDVTNYINQDINGSVD